MIGPGVKIGAGSVVGANVVIESLTTIGERNRIFPFAAVGCATPDLKFHGEPATLEIGDDNTIREFTSIHRGTEVGGMRTLIGNHVLVMPYAHIAHDCVIGDNCILVNSTQLGGHCILEEFVNLEGMSGIHQFVRIGAHAFVAAGAKVAQDVPPYSMVAGDRARLAGVNEIGLQRRGFSAEKILAIKAATRTLFFSKLLREEAIEKALEENGSHSEVRQLVDFINNSKRGVVGRERD